MLHTLERTQHGTHLGGCHAREECHRRRRERILDVVSARDAEFIRPNKNMLRTIPADNDHAVCTHGRPLRQFLASAEEAHLPLCTLCHAARVRVVIVQHEEVVRRLRSEELFLHRLIDLHRAVTDDMVGGYVQLCDDMRMEMRCRLHLIA